MTEINIDTGKLQKAILEFGSLQAAMEGVKEKKKVLENEVAVLEKN